MNIYYDDTNLRYYLVEGVMEGKMLIGRIPTKGDPDFVEDEKGNKVEFFHKGGMVEYEAISLIRELNGGAEVYIDGSFNSDQY